MSALNTHGTFFTADIWCPSQPKSNPPLHQGLVVVPGGKDVLEFSLWPHDKNPKVLSGEVHEFTTKPRQSVPYVHSALPRSMRFLRLADIPIYTNQLLLVPNWLKKTLRDNLKPDYCGLFKSNSRRTRICAWSVTNSPFSTGLIGFTSFLDDDLFEAQIQEREQPVIRTFIQRAMEQLRTCQQDFQELGRCSCSEPTKKHAPSGLPVERRPV